MIVRDRSSGLRLLFVLKGSIILKVLPSMLLAFTLSALIVACDGRLFHHKIIITLAPFTLMGLALAIFLGFRNSVSYDRYWEGRKLWGQLLVASRNLTREIQTLAHAAPQTAEAVDAAARDLQRQMVYRIIAFAHALRHKLRQETGDDELKRFIPAADWPAVAAAANRPLMILNLLGEDLRLCLQRRIFPEYQGATLNSSLNELSAALGGCERIQGTPFPFTYAVLLHRTIFLYCFLLPFGLVDIAGFMTPLLTAFICYTFLGLEAIADELEDPFGTQPNDLPLRALSHTIETDLRAALGEVVCLPPPRPVHYQVD